VIGTNWTQFSMSSLIYLGLVAVNGTTEGVQTSLLAGRFMGRKGNVCVFDSSACYWQVKQHVHLMCGVVELGSDCRWRRGAEGMLVVSLVWTNSGGELD